MEISVLFFDAYGTILESIKYTLLEVADDVVKEYELKVEGEEFLDKWSEEFWNVLNKDFHTIKKANDISLGKMFKKHKIKADPLAYTESLHQRWFYADVYPEVNGILELLEDVPKCVVSNADDDFLSACLDSNGLVFDEVITSESTRSYKPAKKIFKAALKKMGCKPKEAVHLGDSLDMDVVGAANSGITAIWVNREKERLGSPPTKPALEVPDLKGLPALLGLEETPAEEEGDEE
ncbi:MAG: HAD family hydrolase [Thermoplasmata archaeon]|nr:HAD family hydrolase [Thermoplasmata archaeon]MCK4456040.1 HAD family hydrolase [Thermoplasmata archaeon]